MKTIDDDDRIPVVGEYRGVGLHDGQPLDRIETVVKPAIDFVHDLADVHALFDYACEVQHPPEARLFAGAKVEAAWQLCAEQRLQRPDVSLERLRACTAGLNSKNWRDPWHYCSLLDVVPSDVPRREPPLED
jgi:hypothetical protein